MSTGEWSTNYDANSSDDSYSSEQRLWAAVIEKAVWDFRLRLKYAKNEVRRFGKPSSFTLWDLKAIRHEMNSDWFWEMSSYANMDSKRIIKFLDAEALKVGVNLNKATLNPNAFYRRMKDMDEN